MGLIMHIIIKVIQHLSVGLLIFGAAFILALYLSKGF
jgi:hypothetical protein